MPKPAIHFEIKTLVGVLVAQLAGGVIALLNGLNAHSALLSGIPATWQTIIIAEAPMLVTLLAQYATPHTERPDLPAATGPDYDAEAAAYHRGEV